VLLMATESRMSAESRMSTESRMGTKTGMLTTELLAAELTRPSHGHGIAITAHVALLISLILLLLLLMPRRAPMAATATATDGHVPGVRRSDRARHIARALVDGQRRVERIETHRAKTIARIRRRCRFGVTDVIASAITRTITRTSEVPTDVRIAKILSFAPAPVISLLLVVLPPAVKRITAHTYCGDDEKRCEP
jgi:hypothetical protein